MNSCTPTDSEKCVTVFSTDMLNIVYGMSYYICLVFLLNMEYRDAMMSSNDVKQNKAELLFRGFPKLHYSLEVKRHKLCP